MAKKTKETVTVEEQTVENVQIEPIEAETLPASAEIVQAGEHRAKVKVSPGNCADYPVRFPKPFDEGTMPNVVVGFMSGSTAARFGVCACAVLDGSVNHEGFTIRFYNGDVSSRLPSFSYIAFGVVTQ